MFLRALLFCSILIAGTAQAQVEVQSAASRQVRQSVFGLGLSAGAASGFGLSFRHHLPGTTSYQVVGGIIRVDRKTHYSLGGELQFDLSHGEQSRFFGDFASCYSFSGSDGTNDLSGPFRLGAGFGWEWMASGALHMSGELLFTYFSDGTVLPLPQLAAHYYFF